MKRLFLVFTLLCLSSGAVCASVTGAAGAAAVNVKEIVAQAYRARGNIDGILWTIDIQSTENGRHQKREIRIKNRGVNTLAVFLAPAKVRNRMLAIIAALWLLGPLPVAAESMGWGPGLIDSVVDGTTCNLRVLGFGTRTEAADAPGNPDNRILDIKGGAAEIDLRPDFSLDLNRLRLSLQPRLDARWEAWNTGIQDGASQTDTAPACMY